MTKFTSTLKKAAFALGLLGLSAQAFGSVITVEKYNSGYNDATMNGELGGYSISSFGLLSPTPALDTLYSPIDGTAISITTNDSDGKVSVDVAEKDSVSDDKDPDWWLNYTGSEYNIFTTSSNRIEIILPENTLAFAFNVGGNFNGRAWFEVWDQHGGISGSSDYHSGKFSIGGSGNKTPGYGIYADNSGSLPGECNYINKIVIDPVNIWGVGNFGIAQDQTGNCTTEVPEPGTIALFGIGLIGLTLARRKQV